jgi:hypothetical protein
VAIDEEWKRNLLAKRPDLAAKIERTQAVMRRAIPDALVTDYERHIPDLTLPDNDDRHVLAAAIATEAEVIVTFNRRDFPAAALAPHGLIAQHRDVFLQGFTTDTPHLFLAAVRQCFARLVSPPVAPAIYLRAIRQVGLPETATFLENRRSQWEA